jgi:hypothetical protein
MFDTLYSTETISELCVPDLQVDVTTFGRPLTSPETSYAQGGYATGILDCLFGQALMWEWSWNWANANPYVPAQSGGGFACTKIKSPIQGSWDDSYGWCEDN